MTGSRPFRVSLSNEDAKKYLTEWAGIEFDPMIVKTFLTLDLREAETPVGVPRSASADPFEDGFSLI
jgi:HD-GYP domain-containing protein (c-di-GMP phosphodiesterase class II)